MSVSIETLWDEFRNLTAHQRRVVFHMYWDGYTEEETAETMGISRSTVCRALAHAEKRLKNNLKNLKNVSGFGCISNGDTQTANRATSAPRPAVSQNPPPDVYYGSPDPGPDDNGNPQPGNREGFLASLNHVCASAFLQLMDKGGYNESARANRERIEKGRRDLHALQIPRGRGTTGERQLPEK
jgi:sigma-70-like protein